LISFASKKKQIHEANLEDLLHKNEVKQIFSEIKTFQFLERYKKTHFLHALQMQFFYFLANHVICFKNDDICYPR
jgi:hypothetical protein